MLDWLQRLSRRPATFVVVGLLVAVAVIGPYVVGSSSSSSSTTTTSTADTTATDETAPSTTVGADTLEIDRPGDEANPGVLYPGRPDLRENDHERPTGLDAEPARLSGYSVWVAAIALETTGPDQSKGSYLKVTVRVVNRDDANQDLNQKQWSLLKPDGLAEPTDFATPTLVTGMAVPANGEAFGELWFTAAKSGRYWLSFRPDSGSARGVWPIDIKL